MPAADALTSAFSVRRRASVGRRPRQPGIDFPIRFELCAKCRAIPVVTPRVIRRWIVNREISEREMHV